MSRHSSNNEGLNASAMNTQHNTHEQSLDSAPVLNKRLSASIKVRSFISRRISKNLESPYLNAHHQEKSDERPSTAFSQFGDSQDFFTERNTEITGDLIQKDHPEKEVRRQERGFTSTNSSGSYLPLQSPIAESSSTHSLTKSKSKVMPHFPSIQSFQKKKSTFSNLVKRKPVADASSSRGAEEKEIGMAKIHTLRKAMQEGKLERVIPPPSANISSGQNRRPPPRPSRNPFLNHLSSNGSASPSSRPNSNSNSNSHPHSRITPQTLSPRTSSQSARPASRTRNRASGENRIGSLIGNSADILDETRRGIQGKFRSPFEHLNYPSFALGKKTGEQDDDEGDSDESFFCMGDEEPGVLGGGLGIATPVKGEELRPKTRGKVSERGGGQGQEFGQKSKTWDATVMKKCKLCGLGIVWSTRGLCKDCEADILALVKDPPAVENYRTYSTSEYEDDIVKDDDTEEDDVPVTLPLNIRKLKPAAREPDILRPEPLRLKNRFEFHDSDSEDEKPSVPPKDDVVLSISFPNRSYKPSITPIEPTRQNPQRAKVEIRNEAQSAVDSFCNSGWSDSASPSYEEAQRMLERWSDCFGDGVVKGMRDNMDDDDGVPLVRALDCDGVKRNSEFYRFWDEVLKEHAPKTPAGKAARLST